MYRLISPFLWQPHFQPSSAPLTVLHLQSFTVTSVTHLFKSHWWSVIWFCLTDQCWFLQISSELLKNLPTFLNRWYKRRVKGILKIYIQMIWIFNLKHGCQSSYIKHNQTLYRWSLENPFLINVISHSIDNDLFLHLLHHDNKAGLVLIMKCFLIASKGILHTDH